MSAPNSGHMKADLAMKALYVHPDRRRFDALIGVGGIGTGQFFALDGDQTLGREESRSGRLLDRRDYCKLHIIAHYVKRLLGDAAAVYPIGCVGRDAEGERLLQEMADAGLDMRWVRSLTGVPTLSSFCFLYPDGSGGNLTGRDSASDQVDESQVRQSDAYLRTYGPRALVLAVPEVPLAARRALLDLGSARGSYRVAALTQGELATSDGQALLGQVDLLALNRGEASVFAFGEERDVDRTTLFEAAVRRWRALRPSAVLSVTFGSEGSGLWDGRAASFIPALPVRVEGSAGAGDAHLAGLLSGLAAGLTPIAAHSLASWVAALAVTSPHTIHPDLDGALLRKFAEDRRLQIPAEWRAVVLADEPG